MNTRKRGGRSTRSSKAASNRSLTNPYGLIAGAHQSTADFWGAGLAVVANRRMIAPRPFFYSEKQTAAFQKIIDELKPDSGQHKFLIAFCTVRRELLTPTRTGRIDLLRVQDWLRMGMTVPGGSIQIGFNISADTHATLGTRLWTQDDLRLLNATHLFLTSTLPWHEATALGLLEELTRSDDILVAYEATILWLRLLLNSPQVAAQLPLASIHVGSMAIPMSILLVRPSSIFDLPPDGTPITDSKEQRLEECVSRLMEVSSKVPFQSTSLNNTRVPALVDSIEEGNFELARDLANCAVVDDAPQVVTAQPATSTLPLLKELDDLLDAAIHGMPFSKTQARKLSILVSELEVARLSRAELHRATLALIDLGQHPRTAKPWHYAVEDAISRLSKSEHPPQKSSQTMLELAKFYIRLFTDKSQPHEVLHAYKAYNFASIAHATTPKYSPFARDILLCYLVAARAYSKYTSADIRLYDLVKSLDNMTPKGTRLRRETVSLLGMFLSASNREDLLKDAAKTKQLRDYWLENLDYFRIDSVSWNGVINKPGLAWALREAAVATRIHAISMDTEDRVLELRKALELAEEAFLLFPTSRSQLISSFILHELAALLDDWSEYERATQIQSEALASVLKRFSNRTFEPLEEADDSDGLLEVTFLPDEENLPDDFEVYLQFLDWAVSGEIASSLDNLTSHAAEGARLLYQTGNYNSCASNVIGILPHLAKALSAGTTPYRALRSIQGITAVGAASYARLGLPLAALGLLEYGTTFTSRPRDVSTSNVTQVVADYARNVQNLSRRLNQPLIYLASLKETGIALVVRDGALATVWLDDLNQSQVSGWLDTLAPNSPSPLDETTRGPRGTSSPTPGAILSVVTQARAALLPLLDQLQHDEALHVIPTGLNAGIPWTTVFSRPLTTTPSGVLLQGAYTRAAPASSERVVIANPHPITYQEKTYADLPSAVVEAADLHRDFHFNVPLTGTNATKKAFNHAMNQGLEILHIATHAEVDQFSWGDKADILWANNPHTGKAETTPAQSPPPTHRPPRVVFLAACSGAAPDRVLPDEAISFPTALLAAGVNTVIAPLWPISDSAATDFVNLFYENLQSGLTPSHALHLSAETDDPSDLPTFAAFIIAGSNDQIMPS
ncbi:hypothetical protein DM793_03995 [Paenarthrobacter nitroguajacolicus]|uniref:CHAT domain-containing protein n=1 Tax=Paenarthrobacter nitroguajacolicus TaxID=211146 RepID=UPI0015BBE406|nr:CHAT domain-containing protein [Paenarthrobacter nitroguajacolicus]NWL10464.1 hypothetical protein [Paenarthrobacter nitroguajacolicus]